MDAEKRAQGQLAVAGRKDGGWRTVISLSVALWHQVEALPYRLCKFASGFKRRPRHSNPATH